MNAVNSVQISGPLSEAKPREPSIEEILASIRRIIADDQALFSGADGYGAEVLEPPPERAEAVKAPSPAPAVGQPASEPIAAPPVAAEESPLVSPAAGESVAAAFNALVASRFVQNSDVVASVTRELLRPMLAAWLDANLPALVERLVRAEIERVARGA